MIQLNKLINQIKFMVEIHLDDTITLTNENINEASNDIVILGVQCKLINSKINDIIRQNIINRYKKN